MNKSTRTDANAAHHMPGTGALPRDVTVDTLREGPLRFTGTLDTNAREALKTRFELLDLNALDYIVESRPWRGGVMIEGRISAEVVQSCVVTLDPVTTAIEEEFKRGFLPFKELYEDSKPGAELEILSDSELGDIPEPLTDPVDMSEIIAESLSLALPAYPRVEDADPVMASAAPADAAPILDEDLKPFAALEALKTRMNGGSEG